MGEENGGWTLITNQLNFERVAICPVSGILRSIAEVREWAQQTRLADGRRVIDQEWVQLHLARLWARAEYLKLINWKVAWAADKGLNPADASATKVYGSEFALEAYRVLLEIVGQAGYLAEGSPGAVLSGRLEHRAREPDDLHLRRGHQRDPARHHLLGRPGSAAGQAVGGPGLVVNYDTVAIGCPPVPPTSAGPGTRTSVGLDPADEANSDQGPRDRELTWR